MNADSPVEQYKMLIDDVYARVHIGKATKIEVKLAMALHEAMETIKSLEDYINSIPST